MMDRADAILRRILSQLWGLTPKGTPPNKPDGMPKEVFEFLLTRGEMVSACDEMVDELLRSAQRLRACSQTYDLGVIGAMSLYYETLARKVRDIALTIDIIEDANRRADPTIKTVPKSTDGA